MLPRVFYSVALPNSRDNATPVQYRGTCPARAEEMAASNVELVPALCSHGPMGRLFQEKVPPEPLAHRAVATARALRWLNSWSRLEC